MKPYFVLGLALGLAAIGIAASGQAAESPFHGTPATIPGIIQAEDFDEGGEGAAYHATSADNAGGAYRTTDIDIWPTTDTTGSNDVNLLAGEWLRYTVNVTQAGVYHLDVRAFPVGYLVVAPVRVFVDGVDRTGPIPIPNYSGAPWNASWQVAVAEPVIPPAGAHVVQLTADPALSYDTPSGTPVPYTLGVRINYLRFVPYPAMPKQLLAGSSVPGFADGIGTNAQFSGTISGLDVDPARNLYVTDAGNLRVRKISSAGNVTTLAGTGIAGTNDGPALQAQFANLATRGSCLSVDSAGNCYVLDTDTAQTKIRKITPQGIVSTVRAEVYYPVYTALTVKSSGAIDFSAIVSPGGLASTSVEKLFELDPLGHLTTLITVYGTGSAGTEFMDVPSGHSTNLFDLESSWTMNLYYPNPQAINSVSPTGTAATVVSEDNLGAPLGLSRQLLGIAANTSGNLFYADGTGITKVSSNGDQQTLLRSTGLNGRLAVDSQDNVYCIESNRLVKLLNYPGLTLVATTDGGGTVTVDPVGPYLTNTVATVTETTWPGWTFLGWTNDAIGTSPALQFTMTNHLQLKALFGAPVPVTVTNATLQRSPDLALYPYGSQVQLSLQPDLGYQFQSWSDGNTNLVRTLTVTNLISLQATLSAIPRYTVTAAALGGTGGNVQLSPSQGQYFQGTTVVLTAVPNPGYDFQTWLDNVQVNPRTLVVTSNVTLFAAFAPQAGPATIVTGPTDTNVVVGGSVLFSVAAKGAPPLQIQWQLNGTNIAGASNALLILPHAELADAGTYTVAVTNGSGSATASAKLQVHEATGIRFDALTLSAGGQLACTVEGPVGASFQVESSTDLKTWSPVTSLQNTFGVLQLNLSLDTGVSAKFYRIVQVTTP